MVEWRHGLQTPGEEIAFTAWPKIKSQSKIYRYGQSIHCCIKCHQNLQVKTLLQTYTAFISKIYNEILLKVFDASNKGNLLLKLQFFVL